jgi:hypothetical protein
LVQGGPSEKIKVNGNDSKEMSSTSFKGDLRFFDPTYALFLQYQADFDKTYKYPIRNANEEYTKKYGEFRIGFAGKFIDALNWGLSYQKGTTKQNRESNAPDWGVNSLEVETVEQRVQLGFGGEFFSDGLYWGAVGTLTERSSIEESRGQSVAGTLAVGYNATSEDITPRFEFAYTYGPESVILEGAKGGLFVSNKVQGYTIAAEVEFTLAFLETLTGGIMHELLLLYSLKSLEAQGIGGAGNSAKIEGNAIGLGMSLFKSGHLSYVLEGLKSTDGRVEREVSESRIALGVAF